MQMIQKCSSSTLTAGHSVADPGGGSRGHAPSPVKIRHKKDGRWVPPPTGRWIRYCHCVLYLGGGGGGIRDMFGDKYLPNFVKIQASGDANNSQNSFIVIGY